MYMLLSDIKTYFFLIKVFARIMPDITRGGETVLFKIVNRGAIHPGPGATRKNTINAR
jgi:hypothetical protein